MGGASDAIKSILVETFERALTLPNQTAPRSIEEAQYSIPFCIALALVHGKDALLPLCDTHLFDPAVLGLAGRIDLKAALDYRDSFPNTTPARVTMTAHGHKETAEVLYPKGEPQFTLTNDELKQKFMTLTAAPVGRMKAKQILSAIEMVGEGAAPQMLVTALSGQS
jgi:2-methylcitrate dehydratase PrpD